MFALEATLVMGLLAFLPRGIKNCGLKGEDQVPFPSFSRSFQVENPSRRVNPLSDIHDSGFWSLPLWLSKCKHNIVDQSKPVCFFPPTIFLFSPCSVDAINAALPKALWRLKSPISCPKPAPYHLSSRVPQPTCSKWGGEPVYVTPASLAHVWGLARMGKAAR